MRHRKTGRKLGRKCGPRKALMRGLATNLILNGKIKTTEAKAKSLRPIVEKHITKAKVNTLAIRRLLLAYYYDEKAVKILLEDVGPLNAKRPGGYTRILKLKPRQGDAAPMAMIELVGYNKKAAGKVAEPKKEVKKKIVKQA
ncbi:MAG TPA: 50S ribosomal protein L17 [Candidatus Bipolaricaulota bacterium]|nr:50S ribosomal protein L17 [Candidatus Bipolaricaulota bacterium]